MLKFIYFIHFYIFLSCLHHDAIEDYLQNKYYCIYIIEYIQYETHLEQNKLKVRIATFFILNERFSHMITHFFYEIEFSSLLLLHCSFCLF